MNDTHKNESKTFKVSNAEVLKVKSTYIQIYVY